MKTPHRGVLFVVSSITREKQAA